MRQGWRLADVGTALSWVDVVDLIRFDADSRFRQSAAYSAAVEEIQEQERRATEAELRAKGAQIIDSVDDLAAMRAWREKTFATK